MPPDVLAVMTGPRDGQDAMRDKVAAALRGAGLLVRELPGGVLVGSEPPAKHALPAPGAGQRQAPQTLGGLARAAAMSPEQRQRQAKAAAQARWARRRPAVP